MFVFYKKHEERVGLNGFLKLMIFVGQKVSPITFRADKILIEWLTYKVKMLVTYLLPWEWLDKHDTISNL